MSEVGEMLLCETWKWGHRSGNWVCAYDVTARFYDWTGDEEERSDMVMLAEMVEILSEGSDLPQFSELVSYYEGAA